MLTGHKPWHHASSAGASAPFILGCLFNARARVPNTHNHAVAIEATAGELIGMMIVGAGFLYFVTEGLLWLEGYFAINS